MKKIFCQLNVILVVLFFGFLIVPNYAFASYIQFANGANGQQSLVRFNESNGVESICSTNVNVSGLLQNLNCRTMWTFPSSQLTGTFQMVGAARQLLLQLILQQVIA